MKDFQILFSMISQFVGVAAISISLFINFSYRKKALVHFIGLNISLFLIQNAILINYYVGQLSGDHRFLLIASAYMDILGTCLSGLFGVFLVNHLLGKTVVPIKRNIFVSLSILQFASSFQNYFSDGSPAFSYFVKCLMIATIVYLISSVLLNYKYIASKELRRAIGIYSTITLAFLPFIFIEAIRKDVNWLSDLEVLKLLALPSFFLAINIFSIIFAVTYFNSPAFIENNKLTDYFKKKFNITEKESEVIELLVEGLTYKQIADKLFIANKTVDNHIQNIYKKLEVTSKIQLSNLIRSKQK